MDEKQISALLADTPLEDLAKAIKEFHGFHGIRDITDLWNDIHAIPPVAETKTGPTMISSGAGADLGIKNYSNPAKQVGLTQEYAELLHQDLEGWQSAAKAVVEKLDAVMGSFTESIDKLGKSLILKKDEEPKKEEKEEMEKAPEPNKDEKEEEEKKSGMYCSDVNALWDALGELEAAFAKAEEHDEKKDVEGLEEAREHIEKAEQHLEEVEAHEKKEMANKSLVKAEVAINLGWLALRKASKLGGYGLHGYGNQEDAQVSGDSTSDNSKHDMKKAEAKALYWQLKADRLRKANGLKPLRKDEESKKEEEKEEMEKSPEPVATVTATPAVDNTQVDALKAEVDKANATIKAQQTRIDEINQRITAVTGVKLPPMTAVLVKSEDDLNQLNARIEQAVESGTLDAGDADVCQSLGQQFMAANKGYIALDSVKGRLGHASPEVQAFFGVVAQ